ncbi:MAG: peroxiredoxin [Alphaproteobacteria bacterium]
MDLQPGSPAPQFSIPTDNDRVFSLKEHLGKKIVLYFYPKDNTSGCTQQALDFKEQLAKFQHHNCLVLGISKDSLASHNRFSTKYELPFDLGSDPDKKACQLYNVLVQKTLYGRAYEGIDRSTFLINEKGQIEKVWRSVKVNNHVNEVLKCLKSLP